MYTNCVLLSFFKLNAFLIYFPGFFSNQMATKINIESLRIQRVNLFPVCVYALGKMKLHVTTHFLKAGMITSILPYAHW